MQHLDTSPKTQPFLEDSGTIRAQVRFLAYHRIKPHAPPLVRTPVNSFEFHSCERTPQVGDHRLRRGLPGYLILFAPHAFVPERQLQSSKLPSLSVFFMVSMHFTATP